MKSISLTPRAWFDLFLLAGIWGASFLTIKIALAEIGPLTAVLHRTGWAMLILWAYVFWRGLAVPKGFGIWFVFFVMGLFNNVIPFGLMAWGQLYIESGLTAILNASTAVFGVIVAAICFADERLTTRRIIGVGLGFAGVVVAIGLSSLANLDLRSLAQWAVIGGTLSYALAGVWARKNLTNLRPEVAAAGMLTGSTILNAPLVVLFEGWPSINLTWETWAAIAYFAVAATAFAYLLYYRVLAAAGSGNLMLCTLLVTPIAILLGVLVLGETLPNQALLGFGLLAIGLLIINGTLFRKL